MNAPIILSSSVTPAGPGIGSTMTLPAFDMRNAARAPILLDGIRLSGSTTQESSALAGLYVKVLFGTSPLTGGTGGFIPITSLSPLENGTDTGLTVLVADTPLGASCLWKFPKPVYVPPTENVETVFKLFKSTSSVTPSWTGITVRATYVGRTLLSSAVPPQKLCLPWASAFIADTVNGVKASTETDLYNPFSVPLYIDSFTFRSVGAGGMLRYDNAAVTGVNVRMVDPDGRIIIRDLTPLSILCSENYVLPVKAVLRPGGFYKVFLESTVANRRVIVSMRGYREVDYRQTGQG